MLGTFRNMMKDIEEKGYSGEHVDGMRDTLARMEDYAESLDDFMDFSAKLTTENLFGKFSDHYSRVLAANATFGGYDPNGPYDERNDQALLKLMVDALKNAIQSIYDSKAETKQLLGDRAADADVLFKEKSVVDSIQKLIDLGESGISAPEYLRIQTEQNLDKAMEGTALSLDGLTYSHDFNVALAANPIQIERSARYLQTYRDMAAKSAFGVPQISKFNFACEVIDAELIYRENKWNACKNALEDIVSDLFNWALAHTSIAPYIEPWSLAPNPREAIERDKDCLPGMIAVRMDILQRNFGSDFLSLVRGEVIAWEIKYHWFWYSKEVTNFLLDEVLPECQPCKHLSSSLAEKMKDIYQGDRYRNPELHLVQERCAANFDAYFGKGEYNKRYPSNPTPPSKAEPW